MTKKFERNILIAGTKNGVTFSKSSDNKHSSSFLTKLKDYDFLEAP